MVTVEDLHVARDHVMTTTTKVEMYRRQRLRQYQLEKDPDLEMTINNVRDPDLEMILGDWRDPGQETMIMIMSIGVQYILVDYDPSTHLAIRGQLMRRKAHLQR